MVFFIIRFSYFYEFSASPWNRRVKKLPALATLVLAKYLGLVGIIRISTFCGVVIVLTGVIIQTTIGPLLDSNEAYASRFSPPMLHLNSVFMLFFPRNLSHKRMPGGIFTPIKQYISKNIRILQYFIAIL